ncbi:MAG: MATE family efflux transporter [Eubacteriales bacterium]|nr:MATE family efflux transporter [Eubacteriales bacterium]
MQDRPAPENKMGVMPVNRLLITMALPLAISMLVQALYNIVDSIYVSRIVTAVDSSALTAVSLAFPIQNLMIAVASGTSVGVNALLSRSLGEKNQDRANLAAGNGILLAVAGAVLFLLFGLFGSVSFMRSQTDIPEILASGEAYLQIVTVFSGFVFLEIMLERLLQSTGRTMLSMITQGLGAILNIVLDPVFIFGYFGIPAMGVAGAAVATVVGQACAMLLALYFNLRKNPEVGFGLRYLRPRAGIIGTIYAVGIPSIIMMSIGSVMTYTMNRILMGFTNVATAVFGAYFKLQSFVFMPVFGLNNALIPIVAYNYGARKPQRITQALKLAAMYASALMFLGIALFQLAPDKLLMLFDPSENMMRIGVRALRVISISFLFAGFCIVAGGVFQAMGKGMYSVYVSVSRQLVVLLPVAFLFSLTGNLDLVWLAFPIAELASLGMSVFCLRRIYTRLIRPMYQS